MIPASALARPALSEHDARKELLVLAAKYHGVGTIKDLCDYHRIKPTASKQALAELVEEGRLVPVTVRDWTQQAYMHPDAKIPRRVTARALLSPFDPVVWNRERALRHVRVPLPHRDLHAGAETAVRLLRAAVPARRRPRRSRRSEGRPGERNADRPERLERSPASTMPRWPTNSWPSCDRWPRGSNWIASRSPAGAISDRDWRASTG